MCLDCPEGCVDCSDASNCTACKSGYIWENNTCISAAPFESGFMAIKSKRAGKYCEDTGGRVKCNSVSIGYFHKLRIREASNGYVSIYGIRSN